jgi:hypothetical protein
MLFPCYHFKKEIYVFDFISFSVTATAQPKTLPEPETPSLGGKTVISLKNEPKIKLIKFSEQPIQKTVKRLGAKLLTKELKMKIILKTLTAHKPQKIYA